MVRIPPVGSEGNSWVDVDVDKLGAAELAAKVNLPPRRRVALGLERAEVAVDGGRSNVRVGAAIADVVAATNAVQD